MISPESNYVGVLHNPQTHEIDVLTGKGVKMLLECLELYLSIYASSIKPETFSSFTNLFASPFKHNKDKD